ncbi:MAG: dTMP kinase [Candidatus Cloacimonadaceae bacterium]|jgi:dTMP kinase|nr:dTMP kinase [Candidatus Cloacimonadota bacterium]MDX9950172.1 dTMP kinase [Candidatus Syntrophosphaera sp.]
MKGLFITFEGVDGSGKSTQMALLATRLEELGLPVLQTREPGGPPIAEAIRHLLLDTANSAMLPRTELLLYCASRAQHTGEWIIPALKAGKIVLCDRYYDSTFAYQGAARSLDMEQIRILTDFATFHTVPNLTFLLDIPVSEGMARIGKRTLDRLELEDNSFRELVRAEYQNLAKKNPERFVVLDGRLSRSTIHAQIIDTVLTRLGVSSD